MCPESRTALFSPELFKKLAQGGALERPNSCVANFYSDGMQSVDWHADNEPLFEGLLDDCAQTSSLFLQLPQAASSACPWERRRLQSVA